MSTPIIESIAEDIKAAVNDITVENGFNQTLIAIRPRRNDFSDVSPDDLVVLIKQADPEVNENAAIDTGDWLQPFAIMAIVLDSDDASASIDTRRNQVRSDIEKKLTEDVTRGGYAYDTVILPPAEFDDGEGFTGICVRIAVKYRTKFDDPYTQA